MLLSNTSWKPIADLGWGFVELRGKPLLSDTQNLFYAAVARLRRQLELQRIVLAQRSTHATITIIRTGDPSYF